MKGQWIGRYEGTNSGTIVVNVDELPTSFRGVAYLSEGDPTLPPTAAVFQTPTKANNQRIKVEVAPVHPHTRFIDSWDRVKALYAPDVVVPKSADADITWTEDSLKLEWQTDIGTKGSCTLPKSKAGQPSELAATTKNWEEFKAFVSGLEGRDLFFRGQTCPWRLRSAYHRTGRADLFRFFNEDLPILHRQLSALTRHFFNLQSADENGSFVNLVQHHGYPTPLLDWTLSPYVAAFFAFRDAARREIGRAGDADKVRIYVFDQAKWCGHYNQVNNLGVSSLHFSLVSFLAINNERMIPQQAVSSMTNIDDVESYIKSKEAEKNTCYLDAVDLPISERRSVMKELQYMGITAGALFPGLDGACEDVKERRFGNM